MTNKNLLKILFAEDLLSDAELAILELRKEGLRFEHKRVDTRDEFIKALNDFKPDIIISDYMMPSFNGLQALKEAKEFNPEIPFILCTGSINEETAVECIKAGANDYIIKEHLKRLPFAVKEALEQYRILIEKRAAELLLRENEEKLQSIFKVAPVGIGLVVNRVFIEVNDTFCKMIGYSRKELIGKNSEFIYATKEEYVNDGSEKYRQISKKGTGSVETRFKCKNGKILNIILSSAALDKDDLTKGVTFTTMDITERKVAEIALHESEERFRILYNDAIVGLYRTNMQGEIFLANKTLVKMLGFQSFEELSARNLKKSGYGPAYQRQEFIDQIEKSGEVKDLEAIWICRDGEEIFVRESARAIYDPDGKILYFDGTVQNITEQKQTAEALNKIQHLFETLALVSPVGIFRTDPDGYTTYVNPKWSELSGLTPEEALGFNWLNAVHPDDREKLKASWSSDFKSQKKSNAEYRFLRPDGGIVWVMGNAVPEWIDNEIVGYIGTITDISGHKEMEKTLIESEEKYRLLIDTANESIIVVQDGMLKFVNKMTIEMLEGNSEQEFIGRPIPEFIHPDDERMVVENYRRRIANESVKQRYPFRLITRTGIVKWVEINSVLFEWQGKPATLNFLSDITERKRADEAIIHERRMLRTLIDNLPDHIYVKDIKGRKVISNTSDYKDFGFRSEEDVLGKTDLEIFPFPAGQRGHDAEMEVISSGEPVFEREEDFIYPDGTRHWSLSTMIPLIDNTGKVNGLVGIGHDITNRKRIEEELIKAKENAEESDRLKTAFLHNISHEIRTPMNAIVGFSALLGEPDIDLKTQKDYVEVIMQSSNHLLEIISDIVDISNIEANLIKINKANINFKSTLKSLCNQLSQRASEKEIKLLCETEVPDSEAFIVTDSTKLMQVLSNLMNNAIKFTDKGYVKVSCTRQENMLKFSVSDTGIGINEKYHQKIFDRFFQIQSTGTRLYEGTGLGLAISKANVELMGGKIWLDSHPGQGTTFYFTIPYEKQVLKIVPVLENGAPEGSVFSKGRTILVAEDIDSNFKLITYFFSGTNSRIIRAENGKEAVDIALTEKKLDLILMDIKMPVMDGYTAVKLIRQANINIPILAQTAYADDMEKAMEAGCNGFISKPFDRKTLLKAVARFISG